MLLTCLILIAFLLVFGFRALGKLFVFALLVVLAILVDVRYDTPQQTQQTAPSVVCTPNSSDASCI